jgi:pantothenate kinase
MTLPRWSGTLAAALVQHFDEYRRPLKLPVDEIEQRLRGDDKRFLLGITGCPAAGKSTFAGRLEQAINQRFASDIAIVVPMDGFHLSNERLEELGLLPLKGIPETFDAESFTNLLRQIKHEQSQTVYCPRFDRSMEASIADAIAINPSHKLCIVEGNYLLLDTPPWNQCREHLDEVWYLDVPEDVLLPRLLERHQSGGRTPEAARTKVESTDLPNARLINATKRMASKHIYMT